MFFNLESYTQTINEGQEQNDDIFVHGGTKFTCHVLFLRMIFNKIIRVRGKPVFQSGSAQQGSPRMPGTTTLEQSV